MPDGIDKCLVNGEREARNKQVTVSFKASEECNRFPELATVIERRGQRKSVMAHGFKIIA
jgi:hypothetical protein